MNYRIFLKFVPVLHLAVFFSFFFSQKIAHGAEPAQPPGPLLTNVLQVLQFSPSRAGQITPVRLRAVITYADSDWGIYFLKDQTGGVYIENSRTGARLEEGMQVEVEGDALISAFAPILRTSKILVLGQQELPDAPFVSFEQLAGGKRDSQWIELDAIPSSVTIYGGHLRLEFSDLRQVQAFIPWPSDKSIPADLVDARVRLRGVCATRFNARGQLLDYRLFVPNLASIHILEPGLADPFSAPMQSLSAPLNYRNAARFGHRIRSQGIVSAQTSPFDIFAQDDKGAIQIKTSTTVTFQPGDQIEVVGFPDVDGATLRLLHSQVRRVGTGGALPKAAKVDLLNTLNDDWDAKLVTVEGELMDMVSRTNGVELFMRAGPRFYEALLPESRLQGILPGSRLVLTGIGKVKLDEDQHPVGFSLILRTPQDVIVKTAAPWWTIRRVVNIFGAALLITFAWRMHGLRREARLKNESEERFRLLSSAAFEGIVISYQGIILEANQQIADMIGCNLPELIGRPVSEFVGEETKGLVEEKIRSGFEGLYESLLRRKDGVTLQVESRAKIAIFKGLRVRFTALRDITERKRAEEQQARLFMAVEQAGESMMVTDLQGQIVYVNPAFERLTGFSRNEALGQNPRILKSNEQNPSVYQELWQTLVRGQIWRGHLINKRKDGRSIVEEAVISPVRDAAGRVVNYVAVKRDITLQRQMEEELRQSQKMDAVGRLAGGVAHDFNNILAAILLGLETLKGRGCLDDDCRDSISELENSARRAARLTRQLLMFGRRSVLDIRTIDINEVLFELNKMLRLLLGQDITFEFLNEKGIPLVEADRGMMEQVVVNLCVNARDAMPHGGKVTIRTSSVQVTPELAAKNPDAIQGRFVCLSVQDNGCGIDQNSLVAIFEPFYTTKAIGRGTGLGLASVYGIVKQHRGWIEVQSHLQQGSEFRVFLPASSVAVKPISTSAIPAIQGGSETILLVEDEDGVRRPTSALLQKWGYGVLEAANASDALVIWSLHREQIDMLYTDVVMPGGMSGLALATRLKADKPSLKVLVSSGYSIEILAHEESILEEAVYLPKPYMPHELASTLRICFDNSDSIKTGP
ncbi:MAG: signal transduction histidine kinase, nitrogen specific, NtrB [Verrucomicrobiales bacterium]|nr:signal transduction histidine kinase, nitrogen specific, NtrB [Verrucomicrobiales bacterium]